MLLVLLLFTGPYFGQETIEYKGVRSVESLGGVVVDPSGAAVDDVIVEEMEKGWTKSLRSTKTNKDGHFQFSANGASAYYLKFTKYGFHTVLIRVKIKKRAKPLVLTLDVAS